MGGSTSAAQEENSSLFFASGGAWSGSGAEWQAFPQVAAGNPLGSGPDDFKTDSSSSPLRRGSQQLINSRAGSVMTRCPPGRRQCYTAAA